jgi:replicative DNA helicase
MAIPPRPPHSSDAERAYLGGIILGGKGPQLDADDFFLPFHRALYRSFQRQSRKESLQTTWYYSLSF